MTTLHAYSTACYIFVNTLAQSGVVKSLTCLPHGPEIGCLLGLLTTQQVYAPQTTILEGRTNISERAFEALFKSVSTRFGLQTVEKCFESAF